MNLKKQLNALETIEQTGVVCILRLDNLDTVLRLAGALHRGGIKCFEIPLTAANGAEIIEKLIEHLPDDVVVGAGTVLDAPSTERVIAAGASFIVSPHFEPEVGAACKRHDVAFIPGAFSPQEIYQAWRGGADIVKVFSIRPLGPGYLSDLAGPYPQIKLMPTGGITSDNAASFLRAGACAVTIGRDIIGGGPWDDESLVLISERAQKVVTSVARLKAR
jgi:2-dehydro-3-deoxyphosphogluconate aldolase/(4S)-4-hydroxy-2-oxoglutarate aldolase